MKIITSRGPTYRRANGWHAVTDDYDGAPDAHPRDRALGLGETEAEAIADLQEQLEWHS